MTDVVAGSSDAQRKTKVFVSYSRVDLEFAKRIVAALEEHSVEVLIDVSGIEPSEKWWQRIKQMIAQADTVVFVLSPEAVASKVCGEEVEFAASLDKRFVPIVCRRVRESEVPEALRELNWIFSDDAQHFDQSVIQLITALRRDIGWIRRHTQFMELAQRWNAAGRPGPGGLMLRPPLLTDAEALLIAPRPISVPDPALLREFVAASRRSYDQEQATTLVSQLNLLAEVADSRRLRGSLDTALRLCVHAVRRGLAESQLRGSVPTRAAAALAAAVCESDWRVVYDAHGLRARSVAFSPDGLGILTVLSDNTARIWNSSTGDEIAVLRGDNSNVISADFSPDGLRILTALKDNTARIWNASSGAEIATLRHASRLKTAAFSSDGARILTVADDDTARIWDLTGRELAAMRVSPLYSAFFSPDGRRVVTVVLDDTTRIWDAATARQIAVFPRGYEPLETRSKFPPYPVAAFSPDGTRIVTSAYEGKVYLWDASTARQIAQLPAHDDVVTSVAFSPDSKRFVTASRHDGTVCIWDTAARRAIAVLGTQEKDLTWAVFSPDGSRMLTTGSSVQIWDAATGKQITTLNDGHKGVGLAAFSPDGARIVTASADGTGRIWGARHANEIRVLDGPENRMQGLRNPAYLASLRRHEQYEPQDYLHNSAAFSPDGARVVTASKDKLGRIWDAVTGAELRLLSGHEDNVWSAAFSADGTRIVTTSADKTARIWDAATGSVITVLQGYGEAVHAAAFSPDGSYVVAISTDQIVRIWDATNGRELRALNGRERSAAFSADGNRIVTASADGAVRFWDAASGEEFSTLRSRELRGYFAAFNSDFSRVVATSTGNTLHVWDIATGTEIGASETTSTGSASFSPDGLRVLAPDGKVVRIWDAATMREIAVLRGHDDVVRSAAFSPDGLRVVTASDDRSARIWDCRFAMMSTQDLVREACARLRARTRMSRDEMRLAGYPEDMSEIDVAVEVDGNQLVMSTAG